jgi:hypothetical protein
VSAAQLVWRTEAKIGAPRRPIAGKVSGVLAGMGIGGVGLW